MKSLSKRTLALLSLLIILGDLSMTIFYKTNFIFVSYLLCLVGGMAFGSLIYKTIVD